MRLTYAWQLCILNIRKENVCHIGLYIKILN